jgi:hypothetical protein
VLVLFCLAWATAGVAQPVLVSARLDRDTVEAGESTTLRVFAQITPSLQASTDRILTWYVDLLYTNGQVASVDFDSLTRPTSDNLPETSSSGTSDGLNRRAIFDTFLNLPDAGRLASVELFSVRVLGQANGQTTFRVQAGTTAPTLQYDFQVAPAGGGAALTGGDYSAAMATLQVGTNAPPTPPTIAIAPGVNAGELLISYPVQTGTDHWVEYLDDLSATNWTSLPGGPHNSGQVTVPTTQPARFYRVRVGG